MLGRLLLKHHATLATVAFVGGCTGGFAYTMSTGRPVWQPEGAPPRGPAIFGRTTLLTP